MNSNSEFKTILLLVTQMERAGAQKVALRQARYFHQQGYKVTLCFFYDKYSLLDELRLQEAYSIVDLQAKVFNQPFRNGLRTIRALWRLYWLLKRQKISVIETLTRYSNVLGIVVAWLAGVPIRVSSQRNTLLGVPNWFLRLDAMIVNSPLVDKMIAVSEQTRHFCIEKERMSPHKIATIPNGVNLAEFEREQWLAGVLNALRTELHVPQGTLVITTVARLYPQKGHQYLVEAASIITSIYPNVLFLLIGDGVSRETIEASIRAYNLDRNFRLLGIRSDVPKLLALSDVFVLPSLYEGMPNVVLEAMAARLPVVATNVDGTQAVVVDGETGLLVPKADSDALAQAICKLLEDAGLREYMGQNGYDRVRLQFSEQMMCHRYEELIRAIWKQKIGY